jgi:hypothetical protein
VVEDDEDMRPAPRKNTAAAPASAKRASGDWDDPFETAGSRKSTGTRRAAPAVEPSKPAKAPARRGGGGKWDDPFTSDEAPASKPSKAAAHPVVATREPAARHESKKFAATPTATHKVVAAEEPAAKTPAQGRWGSVLKKRR